MKNNINKIFVRADATKQIGYGHVIRCISLIAMIKDDYDCYFIIRNPTKNLIDLISKVCITCHVLPETLDFSIEAKYISANYLENNSLVVLDGYEFDTNYQSIIKEKVFRLISIDDVHPYHFVSDAIINQIPINIDAYSAEIYTKIYSGFKYSLLREPFIDASQTVSFPLVGKSDKVFICFGGSDFLNLTSHTLRSVLEIENIHEVHIVIGSEYGYLKELQTIIKNQTNKNIEIYRNIGSTEMVEVLKKCNTAIVPASSILIECIACGVSFVTGFYVDNQKEFINFLIQNKLIETAVDFKNISVEELRKIIFEHKPHNQIEKLNQYRNQIKFVKQNIITMMHNTIGGLPPLLSNFHRGKFLFKSFSLLNEKEMKQILDWRNHDIVRKWMFNKNIIEEKDHINFIMHLHEKKDKAYWLVFKDDKPMGVVNLINFTGESCEWGIYIRPDMIGSGLGIDIQYYFLNILFTEINIKTLIAFINTDNNENLKVQQLFDFNLENEIEYIDDIPYYKLILQKKSWLNLEKDIKAFKLSRLLLNRKF